MLSIMMDTVLDFICAIKSYCTRMQSPNVIVGPRKLTENNQGHQKQSVVWDCVQSVCGPLAHLEIHKR